MLIQVDFCLIVVSKLHMWFRNYICCFETTLENVETTYHHVEKVSYNCGRIFSILCHGNSKLCCVVSTLHHDVSKPHCVAKKIHTM